MPPQNQGDYSQSTGSAQEQALRTEKFWQNQAMFRKYTAVEKALKKFTLEAVEPVFLSPLVDQLTGFGQVSALTILQHLFFRYGAINEIDLDENAVNTMGPYNPA